MGNLEAIWLQEFDTNQDDKLSYDEFRVVLEDPKQSQEFKRILNTRETNSKKDKEELDRQYFWIAKDLKSMFLDIWVIDRNNIWNASFIQVIAHIEWLDKWLSFSENWWQAHEDTIKKIYSPEELSKIQILWNFITNSPASENNKPSYESIKAENKIAIMLTQKLQEIWISPELISQITDNAEKFKQVFPEIELYLSQWKLSETITFLENNSKRLDEVKDLSLKKIFQAIIEALHIAEITENPEKLELLKTKQKIQIVLDTFEVINSDNSVIYLDNEKDLYYSFQKKVWELLQNKDLSKEALLWEIQKLVKSFEESIRAFTYKQNPLPKWWDPRTDIHYRDIVTTNDDHTKRIYSRFTKFSNVLSEVINDWNLNSKEQIYTKSLNSFVNTTSDNPLTNPDLRLARKEMTATLREKMRNNFKTFYDIEFHKTVTSKYSPEELKKKVEEAKEEVKKLWKEISEEELETRALYYVQKTLEQEFEKDIFINLSNNKNIPEEQRVELEKYIDLFDPKNELFNIWIDWKNNILEETISLPLTAFAIWRISKLLFWATQATLTRALTVDFIEWAWFELATRLRQNRLDMSSYTFKDFAIWSAIWAWLFFAMKVDKITLIWWKEIPIKFDESTLMNRWANHLIETWIFTWIEWAWTYAWYWENIFADEQAEKILNNIWILYLVKLWYSPRELWWVLPPKLEEVKEVNQAIRWKESPAKMKWVWATRWDATPSINIRDALSWNIENVMTSFRWTTESLNTEFQRLLQSWKTSESLKIEASTLIKTTVDDRVRELELQWVKINSQEDLDYIATYKLQRIEEFKRLLEVKEKTWETPKEIEMTLDWFPPWKLNLENAWRMNEYLTKFVENMKRVDKTNTSQIK